MKKIIATVFTIVLFAGCMTAAKSEEAQAQTQLEDQQTPYGFYCCDASGVKRCVMPVSGPVGGACYCNGQGWGWTCP
jgi:hypothetical protein